MAGFAYNNAKNTSTNHTLFKLNCNYYSRVLFKKDVDLYLKSHSANKLVEELRKLMEVYYQNLFHVQELQKRAHNKEVKSHSYIFSEKIWLNS